MIRLLAELMISMITRIWILVIISVLGRASSAQAEWQWPSDMNIGGFNVTGIRGSVQTDGSGSANGSIAIPGMGSQQISLSRSSRGDVTGNASINGRTAGVELSGKFSLNNSGLRGSGTIRTSPKPITDATISINSSGDARGNGRVDVGGSSVNVQFSISNSLDVDGSTRVRDEKDTPLAGYKLDGKVSLSASGSRLEGEFSGQVTRTGKLANQVTNHSIKDASVNLSDGKCTVNICGVSVNFDLF